MTEKATKKMDAPYMAVGEFIPRTEATKLLYDAKDAMTQAVEKAAKELVKLLDASKLKEYNEQSIYWHVGIPSEILTVLNAFERNASVKAVLAYLDGRGSRLTDQEIRALRRIAAEWEEARAKEKKEGVETS